MGVMGRNLALNIASKGFNVAVLPQRDANAIVFTYRWKSASSVPKKNI